MDLVFETCLLRHINANLKKKYFIISGKSYVNCVHSPCNYHSDCAIGILGLLTVLFTRYQYQYRSTWYLQVAVILLK